MMSFHASLHSEHNHLSMPLWAGQQRRRLLFDSITRSYNYTPPPVNSESKKKNNDMKIKLTKSQKEKEIKAARDTFNILSDSIMGKEKEEKSKKKMEEELNRLKLEQELQFRLLAQKTCSTIRSKYTYNSKSSRNYSTSPNCNNKLNSELFDTHDIYNHSSYGEFETLRNIYSTSNDDIKMKNNDTNVKEVTNRIKNKEKVFLYNILEFNNVI